MRPIRFPPASSSKPSSHPILHFLQGPQVFGQNAQSRTSMNNFHDWSIIAEHTWTIGSNKVNEFRFQYARRSVNYSYSNAPGGSDVAVNMPGFAFFGREPFSYVQRVEQRWEFLDNFSIIKGTHNIKFGGDYNLIPLTADFTVNLAASTTSGAVSIAGTPGLTPVQSYGAKTFGPNVNSAVSFAFAGH